MSKIAFFIPTLEYGGAEKITVSIANSMLQSGYQVEIVLARKCGDWLKYLDAQIKIVDLHAARTLYSIFPLIRYLRKSKPDILFSTLEFPNILAIVSKWLSGFSGKQIIKATCMVGHRIFYKNQFEWLLMRSIIPFVYPNTDAAVAISNGVAKSLAHFGVNESKITVIYNPIQRKKILDVADQEVDHPWFVEANECPVVISIGSLTKVKDHKTLIRAFKHVREHMKCRLVIFGEGYLRNDLSKLIDELNLTEDVHLAGFVTNPYAYMKRASVFVLSSITEGFSNVLLEAMICGCPIVSTDCPSGPAELLKNGQYGELVPVNDPLKMGSAIINILEGRHSKKVDERWLDQFEYDHIIEQYKNVIDKTICQNY